MHPYELKTHFKEDPKLRAAFIALSTQIFDLDFEPWFQAGGWDNTYQPFTYFDGDLAVANVSVSHMTLIIDGQAIPALQVGTVMTLPEYRRRGLAKSLFQEVFKVYPPNQYQYFLAADDEAVPLYQLMGFEHWNESRFRISFEPATDSTELKPEIQATQVTMTAQELVTLKQAKPINDAALQVVNDESILKFYYVMGFNQFIYKILNPAGDLIGHALLEGNGTQLKVYALYQNLNEIDIVTLANQWGFTEIQFMYTPSNAILETLKHQSGMLKIDIDSRSQWMVHQGYADQLAPMPNWPIAARFPKISQT